MPLPFAPVPVVTPAGAPWGLGWGRTKPSGDISLPFNASENPEIQPLPAISQQISSVDGSDERVPSEPILDYLFLIYCPCFQAVLFMKTIKGREAVGGMEFFKTVIHGGNELCHLAIWSVVPYILGQHSSSPVSLLLTIPYLSQTNLFLTILSHMLWTLKLIPFFMS